MTLKIRRAHRARLPVTALLGLALVAGCSSSGGAAPTPSSSPSTGASRTSSSSAPGSQAPSQTPVGLRIQPSPTAIKRAVTRPAGASRVGFHTCVAALGVVDIYLKNQIFSMPDVNVQLAQLAGAGRLARSERKRAEKARRTWLRDGYPRDFPVVRDLDALIGIYNKVIAAATAKNLNPLPALYLRYRQANAQYAADADDSVCGA